VVAVFLLAVGIAAAVWVLRTGVTWVRDLLLAAAAPAAAAAGHGAWLWRICSMTFDDAVMMKALAATSVGSLPALAPWSVGHLHGKRQEEIV